MVDLVSSDTSISFSNLPEGARITALNDGRYLATWAYELDKSEPFSQLLYEGHKGQFYSANGIAEGDNLVLSEVLSHTSSSLGISSSTTSLDYYDIIALDDGGFSLIYQRSGVGISGFGSSGNYLIQYHNYQSFSNDGTSLGTVNYQPLLAVSIYGYRTVSLRAIA